MFNTNYMSDDYKKMPKKKLSKATLDRLSSPNKLHMSSKAHEVSMVQVEKFTTMLLFLAIV